MDRRGFMRGLGIAAVPAIAATAVVAQSPIETPHGKPPAFLLRDKKTVAFVSFGSYLICEKCNMAAWAERSEDYSQRALACSNPLCENHNIWVKYPVFNLEVMEDFKPHALDQR